MCHFVGPDVALERHRVHEVGGGLLGGESGHLGMFGDEAGGHVRIDDPRTDRIHAHLVRRHLERQATGQADDCMLGDVVGTLVGRAPFPGSGGKHDDAARLAGDHPGQHALSRVHHADKIHFEEIAKVLWRVVQEGCRAMNASIVDQYIDAPARVGRRNHRLYFIAVGDVAGIGVDFGLESFAQIRGHLIQARGISRIQQQTRALRGIGLGDGEAYAAAGAGD